MPASPRVATVRVSTETRLTAVIVACALFMQNLDSTVIATALPTMARAFGTDPIRMNVALTPYLLSLTVFIPASGWVADRSARAPCSGAAIIVFTVGSVLCGLSDGLIELVAARILQGIGGAMMVPVGRLLLLRTAAKSELVAAMAWLTMPALLGPVVGPPVGGFIVTYFNWRWTFYINIPVGISAWSPSPSSSRIFVSRRAAASICAASCCPVRHWRASCSASSPGAAACGTRRDGAMMLAGLAGAFLYYLHARRHQAPLLDFTLMRLPCFGLSFCAMMLFRTGIGAIPFLLPMMLQVGSATRRRAAA